MAAPLNVTGSDSSVEVTEEIHARKTKSGITEKELRQQALIKEQRLAANQKMVEKYHAMFPKVPCMTSKELVDRWRQIDKMEDEKDDSDGSDQAPTTNATEQPGPLLLIDVRSKAEQKVSMIQGALAMEDMETTNWINRYVHNFDGIQTGGIPTIVLYCTVGYRSGREAQWLIDDLSSTYGIEIGKAVEIKNLDGILAYSFVEDAPPLLRPCHKGSSDSFMTRRIHTYGREWAEAVHPSFDTVCFDSKPKKALHLMQTGLLSGVRMLQRGWFQSKTKAVETKNVVAKTCVEPVANMAGTSIIGKNNENTTLHSRGPAKRISATGYTTNKSTKEAYLDTDP